MLTSDLLNSEVFRISRDQLCDDIPAFVFDLAIGLVPSDGISIERDSKATTKPVGSFVLPTHLSPINCSYKNLQFNLPSGLLKTSHVTDTYRGRFSIVFIDVAHVFNIEPADVGAETE